MNKIKTIAYAILSFFVIVGIYSSYYIFHWLVSLLSIVLVALLGAVAVYFIVETCFINKKEEAK